MLWCERVCFLVLIGGCIDSRVAEVLDFSGAEPGRTPRLCVRVALTSYQRVAACIYTSHDHDSFIVIDSRRRRASAAHHPGHWSKFVSTVSSLGLRTTTSCLS